MIVANMATFPARANGLEGAVARVARQVDRLNICLNDYSEIPGWLARWKNVNPLIPDRDLKDIGKFCFAVDDRDDVFLMDDDLEYPCDYVSRSLTERDDLARLRGSPLVGGYHGTIYLRWSAARFLKDLVRRRDVLRPHPGRARIVHRYFDSLARARIVAQLGTGTVVLRGAQMPPLEFMRGGERRADVRFARWCWQQGHSLVALPRAAGWLPADGDDAVSLYSTYTKFFPDDSVHELRGFAFRVPHRGQYLY